MGFFGQIDRAQGDTVEVAAAFDPASFSGMLYEDAPHGLGRGDVEVGPILPGHFMRPDQANIGFMNQGRCLERVLRALAGHLFLSGLAELFIDLRQELLGRPWIPLSRRFEKSRNVGLLGMRHGSSSGMIVRGAGIPCATQILRVVRCRRFLRQALR